MGALSGTLVVLAVLLWTVLSMYLRVVRAARRVHAAQLSATFTLIDADESEALREEASVAEKWAAGAGYEWVGAFDFSIPGGTHLQILAWGIPGAEAFLAKYLAPRAQAFEFHTGFEGSVSISTSNSPDSNISPRPFGSFAQSFPGENLDSLFRLHLEAEEYVQRALSVRHAALQTDLLTLLNQDSQRQLRHIMSLPMWSFRYPVWYFTRSLRTRRSIRKQFPRLGSRQPVRAE